MLAKIAPKFVINRVIQHGYFAKGMAIDLLKIPFGHHTQQYTLQDSKKYFECKFYSYIASQKKPKDYFKCKYQQEKYDEACQSLAEFRNILNIVNFINQFTLEVRQLYSFVEINSGSANIFSHHQQTIKEYESDVLSALQRYNNFLNTLIDKPQWQTKVTEQVGKWFHLIHNNLSESEAKRNIFQKMNRQVYFV